MTVSRKEVHPESLDAFNVQWQEEPYDDYYLHITPQSQEQMERLREHTREIFASGRMRSAPNLPAAAPHVETRPHYQYVEPAQDRSMTGSSYYPPFDGRTQDPEQWRSRSRTRVRPPQRQRSPDLKYPPEIPDQGDSVDHRPPIKRIEYISGQEDQVARREMSPTRLAERAERAERADEAEMDKRVQRALKARKAKTVAERGEMAKMAERAEEAKIVAERVEMTKRAEKERAEGARIAERVASAERTSSISGTRIFYDGRIPPAGQEPICTGRRSAAAGSRVRGICPGPPLGCRHDP